MRKKPNLEPVSKFCMHIACVFSWTNLDKTHVLRILIFAFSMQIWFFSQAWVQRHKSDFREIGNLINGFMKNGGKKKERVGGDGTGKEQESTRDRIRIVTKSKGASES